MRLLDRPEQAKTLFKCFCICCFIPLYFVLEANNKYWQLIPLKSSIEIGLISFFSVSACFIVLQFYLRRENAVLVVCWAGFNYLYFAVIYKTITSVSFLSFFKPYKFYLPVLLFISILFFYSIWKMKLSGIKKLLSYVTLLLSFLIIVELYKVIQSVNTNTTLGVLPTDKIILNPSISVNKPDIFLIVMDEYAGFNFLAEHYNYDNTEFANKLQALGFFVARNSRANYNGTLFSTYSLLNMAYLDTSSMGDVKSPKTYAKVAKAISENLLFDFFRNSSYNVVNNSFLRIKNSATKPFIFLPIEHRLMTDKTFGNILQNHLLLNLPSNRGQFLFGTLYSKYDSYNQRTIKNLNEVAAGSKPPLFLYTHLLMPHSPYLRDGEGHLRRFSEAYAEFKSKKYRESYLPYLRYCNKVVGRMIDSIQKLRENAIIILVSDHGNRFVGSGRDLKGDFSNFIAVYSPDKNYNGFTDSVSLVNVFRLLLNNQFGQSLNILPTQEVNVTKGVLN